MLRHCCREALQALARVGPILEVGAGTGYWVLKMREAGVQVTAVDLRPPGEGSGNLWHKGIPAMTEAHNSSPAQHSALQDLVKSVQTCPKVFRRQQAETSSVRILIDYIISVT